MIFIFFLHNFVCQKSVYVQALNFKDNRMIKSNDEFIYLIFLC